MRYVVIFFIILVFRLILFYLFPLSLHNGESIRFTATLFEDPTIRGNNQEFSLRLGTVWQGTKVTVVTSSDIPYSCGQDLEVDGTLSERLLKNKNVVMIIQNPKIKAKNGGFLPLFGAVRQKIIKFCENNFSQPYSGLLVGIVFGVKSELTQEITRSFRITGLSHIVAASGMNVTLVAGFLFGLLAIFLRRQEAIVCSILGIFLYVCISGFDAPIVRAALMGAVAFSASLFGRQYHSVYMLIFTAIIMLLWNPLLLADVGFQLSFLATAGILLLKPLLFGSHFLIDDVGTTVSAQIATLPILLGTFGQYSLLSIFANILVLWTIPLITIVGSLGIVIGLFFEPLGKMIILCILPLLWYLQQATHFFSSHLLSISVGQLPIFFLVGYYLFVGGMILMLQKVKSN